MIRRGLTTTPDLRDWTIAALVGWFWSVPLGLLAWLGAVALGPVASEAALWMIGGALALVFAPAFSWVGLVIAMPLAILAARHGRLGVASALGIGALAGTLSGAILGGMSILFTAGFGTIAMGAVLATLVRLGKRA
jgi:hypothetical protein